MEKTEFLKKGKSDCEFNYSIKNLTSVMIVCVLEVEFYFLR